MASASKLVDGVQDTGKQKRIIIACLLQTVVWAIFTLSFIIGESIQGTIDDEDTELVYILVCVAFLGVSILLLALGEIISCQNASEVLCGVVMVVFYVSFGVFAVTLAAIDARGGRGIYTFLVGFPLALLSTAHLLWAIFRSTSPFNATYSIFVMILAMLSPPISLLVHQAFYESHPHIALECVIATLAHTLLIASWISCLKRSVGCKEMQHCQRFFFVFSGSIMFSVVFALGITVLPLICGLRYCCVKYKEPVAPTKPTAPTKPRKPVEPKIGSATEEWAGYRRSMTTYRGSKQKWKEEDKYFRENQTQLLVAYEKKLRQHRKTVESYKTNVESPAKAACCNYCKNTTLHIMFCRSEHPPVMQPFLSKHEPL